MISKIQASKELWGKLIGKVDTPEKFEAAPVGAGQPCLGYDEADRQPGMPQLSLV